MGRIQSVEQTRRLYEHARALGYTGINFDLIFGLPKQRPETFERTLEQVVELGPDRVAVFSYAHVPWMRSHQRRFDEALIPRPVERFMLFAAALRHFLEAGYLQIGMDHFARPDDELARARLSSGACTATSRATRCARPATCWPSASPASRRARALRPEPQAAGALLPRRGGGPAPHRARLGAHRGR